jgi:hypothetical protein
LPPNCRRHYETMMERPAVKRVLAADESRSGANSRDA